MRNPDSMQHVVLPRLRKFAQWHTLTISQIWMNRRFELTHFPSSRDYLPPDTMEQQSELDEKIHFQMLPASRKSDIQTHESVCAYIIILPNKMGKVNSNFKIVKLFL